MMTRNKLAAYKERGGAWDLPPPIQSEHRCKHCFSLSLCAVVHRTLEGGTAESFGLEVFDALTAHIDEKDATFLKTWLELLEIERAEAKKKHPQENIWALDPPPHTRPVQQAPSAPVQACDQPATAPTKPVEGRPMVDCENTCPNSQPLQSLFPNVDASEVAEGKGVEVPQSRPLSAPAQSVSQATHPPPGAKIQTAPTSALTAPSTKPVSLSTSTFQNPEEPKDVGTCAKHPLQGRCIGHLQLESYHGQEDGSSLYPHKYSFTQCQPSSCMPPTGGAGVGSVLGSTGAAGESTVVEMIPLSSQGFSAGDCGILSLQGRHVAVNRAQVETVTENVLTVCLRSRLSLGFEQGCTIKGSACAKHMPKEGNCCSAQPADSCTKDTANLPTSTCFWRIDKDEPETAFQIAVSGVLELVVSMSLHTTRLRRLLIHFKRPMKEARANYDAEVPPEVDHVEAMVESEYVLLHCIGLLH